jgi:opacity protein-like surface antigen
MKKALAVLVCTLIVGGLAYAGDNSMPKQKSGDKAFLFTLNGLSNIGAGSYQGGVGGLYYVSDGNAIRLSLGFGTSTTTTKYTGTANPNFADQKVSTMSFSIMPAFIHDISISGAVQAYIGGQLMFGTSSTTTENVNFAANTKVKDSETFFGIAGLAGVEWFAWDNISLAAEYVLGYQTSSGTHETTNGGTTTSTDAPTTTGFGMGSASSANLTVAIYF